MSSVDMGGIAWPVRGGGTPAAAVGSVRLDRQLAYTGNPVGVTALGTDGQPVTGPLEAVLTSRDGEVRRQVEGGSLSTANVPPGRYRVTVGGVAAGPLRVL